MKGEAMHRHVYSVIVMILAATLLTACGSADKGPAETAIKAAEAAVSTAKAEVSKYLPDQANSLDSALTAVKEKFAKGDYKAVLTDAQALTSKAQELASAAAAKKAELTKSWQDMSAGLPKVVDAIKSRVDILSQSKKLPAGMTKEKLAEAKTGLAEITQQWTEATAASTGGNLMDAIAKATAVKRKAAEVLTALNMPVPEALKS
jgi:major membrane immunogen (membrane-anchored lipoprotein)